jgi:hypothetical protein
MFSFTGAVILGVLAAFVGRESGHTSAVSRDMLMFLGGCLGAIAGAVIGASFDIVLAIRHNQRGSRNPDGG